MRVVVRRILATVIGAATALLLAGWTVVGRAIIYRYVLANLSLNIPLSQADGPRPDAYDQAAHPFFLLLLGALVVATGFTAALLVLIPRRSFRVRAAVYLVFLAVLLPASFYNYSQKDNVLPAMYQVGLNVVIVFLGATIALSLSKVRVAAPDTRVLKTMGLGLVLFGAVLVPGLFSLVWAVWRSGIVQEVPELGWGDLTIVGGLASAVIVVWLNYRRELPEQGESNPAVVGYSALHAMLGGKDAIEAQEDPSRFSAGTDTVGTAHSPPAEFGSHPEQAQVSQQGTSTTGGNPALQARDISNEPLEWDFFLAYASADRSWAESLYAALSTNHRVFLDAHAVRPGDDWPRSISRALAATRLTIILISANSEEAHYLRDEISTAIQLARKDAKRRRVIPVFLDGFPSHITAIPYGLGSIQGLDARKLGMEGIAVELRKATAWLGDAVSQAHETSS